MKCPYCNKHIKQNTNKCPHCNRTVDTTNTTIYEVNNTPNASPSSSKVKKFFVMATKPFVDFWTNYINFNGRTNRKDFWITYAWLFIVACLLSFSVYLIVPFALAMITPFIALFFRRFNDAGFQKELLLVALIPIGTIIVLVMCCLPTDYYNTKNFN